jgi:hypothetical protein
MGVGEADEIKEEAGESHDAKESAQANKRGAFTRKH